jgi:hypothetical protein
MVEDDLALIPSDMISPAERSGYERSVRCSM